MRCPKCGYNSFDHLDNCKKCGKDLAEHKQKFGIVSVLFPGQMAPVEDVTFAEDETVVEDVVAAAVTESVAETVSAAVDEPLMSEAAEGDDFGFDFMGDSDEEEDLSFDELFEEAAADEDVEETLPSPEPEVPESSADDFDFDLDSEADAAESELEDDFGFDPTEDEDSENNDFSFEPDEPEDDDNEGAGEDPKSPFDLPESAQFEEAPELHDNFSENVPENVIEPDSVSVVEDALLSAEVFSAIDDEQDSLPSRADLSNALTDDAVATTSIVIEGPPAAPVAAESESALADVSVEPDLVEDLLPESATWVDNTEESAPVVPQLDLAAKFPSAQALIAEIEEEPEAESFVRANVTDNLAEDKGSEPDAAAAADPDETLLEAEKSVAQATETQDEKPDKAEKTAFLPATNKRIVAFACDLLLLFLVGTSFVIAAEAAMSPGSESLLPSTEVLIDLSIPYFLVLFSLAFGYFTLFHFLVGQTPGKMLAGLRVETLNGEPLLFSQAFLRSVGGLLQLLPIGLGYLVILSSPERRGWNDRLAGTRLISLRGVSEEG